MISISETKVVCIYTTGITYSRLAPEDLGLLDGGRLIMIDGGLPSTNDAGFEQDWGNGGSATSIWFRDSVTPLTIPRADGSPYIMQSASIGCYSTTLFPLFTFRCRVVNMANPHLFSNSNNVSSAVPLISLGVDPLSDTSFSICRRTYAFRRFRHAALHKRETSIYTNKNQSWAHVPFRNGEGDL